MDIAAAIPDSVENLFEVVISEGGCAINTDEFGWIGTLTGFQGGDGYWIIVEDSVSFSYKIDEKLARSAHTFVEKLPEDTGFNVVQSSRQAFYFVDKIMLNNGEIEPGDWLLSFNGNVLAGIRQWTGNMIDLPAMGVAGDEITAGYFDEGDSPIFKVLSNLLDRLLS